MCITFSFVIENHLSVRKMSLKILNYNANKNNNNNNSYDKQNI